MSATALDSAPAAQQRPPSAETGAGRIARAGSLALCVAAAVPLAVFAWLAVHRVGYPYELDWMEGGSVGLAARVLHGHSLYVAPSLTYVGWTYPPLYYWLSAAVAEVTGIGFAPLRLISALASGVSMITLAAVVVRQSGDRVAALVAAGLFAAAFALSGYWFDVGAWTRCSARSRWSPWPGARAPAARAAAHCSAGSASWPRSPSSPRWSP